MLNFRKMCSGEIYKGVEHFFDEKKGGSNYRNHPFCMTKNWREMVLERMKGKFRKKCWKRRGKVNLEKGVGRELER